MKVGTGRGSWQNSLKFIQISAAVPIHSRIHSSNGNSYFRGSVCHVEQNSWMALRFIKTLVRKVNVKRTSTFPEELFGLRRSLPLPGVLVDAEDFILVWGVRTLGAGRGTGGVQQRLQQTSFQSVIRIITLVYRSYHL